MRGVQWTLVPEGCSYPTRGVVSLTRAAATAERLPAAVDQVAGDIDVIAGGGIGRGSDISKARRGASRPSPATVANYLTPQDATTEGPVSTSKPSERQQPTPTEPAVGPRSPETPRHHPAVSAPSYWCSPGGWSQLLGASSRSLRSWFFTASSLPSRSTPTLRETSTVTATPVGSRHSRSERFVGIAGLTHRVTRTDTTSRALCVTFGFELPDEFA